MAGTSSLSPRLCLTGCVSRKSQSGARVRCCLPAPWRGTLSMSHQVKCPPPLGHSEAVYTRPLGQNPPPQGPGRLSAGVGQGWDLVSVPVLGDTCQGRGSQRRLSYCLGCLHRTSEFLVRVLAALLPVHFPAGWRPGWSRCPLQPNDQREERGKGRVCSLEHALDPASQGSSV